MSLLLKDRTCLLVCRQTGSLPNMPSFGMEFCAVLAIGGLVAPMDFMSAMGDLLPMTLWGLTLF